jgi:tetratricopeptide (TPR) repeat protein
MIRLRESFEMRKFVLGATGVSLGATGASLGATGASLGATGVSPVGALDRPATGKMPVAPPSTPWLHALVAAACFAAVSSSAGAADRVKLLAGNQSTGKIVEISPTEVVVEVGSIKRKHPVNEIESVTYDAEPNELTQARFAVAAGRYADALALLEKVDPKDITRQAVVADVEFYKGLAAARLALDGSGSIADAGKRFLAFEKEHNTSFHYFEACETLGDMLVAVGNFDRAAPFYDKLAAAPWPELKLRAGVLSGRALVGQKAYDRAIARFDEVLATAAAGKEADRQKLAAALGKATALAGAGKTEEAIASVDEIIAKADPEDHQLHARAYNVLGNCYNAAGKKKEALLAFLHVDLLYSRFPQQHAEALANLATLWAQVDKADRAAAAQALLKEKYPTSAWAQK